MLLFSFSIFSDRRSLKIEKNENKITKTLTAEASYTCRTIVSRVQFINIQTYPGWLELPLTGPNLAGPNLHGPKPIRATCTEVLL